MNSYWLDQRDVPDSKWGKSKPPGCTCSFNFTCRVCLDRTVARNQAESFGSVTTREIKEEEER